MAASHSSVPIGTAVRSGGPDAPPDPSLLSADLFWAPWNDWGHWLALSPLLDGERTGGMIRHWTLMWQDQWRRQLRMFGLFG